LSKKKKKKKLRDDPTSAEKEVDENVSTEQSTITKEKKSKSVAFATESSEVRNLFFFHFFLREIFFRIKKM
jgi:hypothetical protein